MNCPDCGCDEYYVMEIDVEKMDTTYYVFGECGHKWEFYVHYHPFRGVMR